MIAVIDSNAIIFMALMRLNNIECFNYLKTFFSKIIITQKVYEEVFNNNKFNRYRYFDIEDFDEFINEYRKEILGFKCNDDISYLHNFIHTSTDYSKEDGEFFSTAMALHCSRYEGNDFNEFLLKTFIITDDEKAMENFKEFYDNNLIGRFLSIIDSFTLLFLINKFTKENYLDSFKVLIYLYSKDLYQAIREIKIKKEELGDSNSRDQLILSDLLSSIEQMRFDELSRILNDKKIKQLIPQQVKSLEEFITKIVKSNKISKIIDRYDKIGQIFKAV